MQFDREVLGGIFEEMLMESAPLTLEDRARLAQMYSCIVRRDPDWRQVLDSNQHLLDVEFSMEHTTNCSCGRFFEQHPTTIDDVEDRPLGNMARQVETGTCMCLINSDPTVSWNLAVRSARKTLLHAAAASGYGQFTEIVEYLLEKNCSVNQMTGLYYYTPLFRAICSKNTAVVSVLLKHQDINVNLRSRTELHAPLLEAILNRHTPIVTLLLEMPSVELDIRNYRQETPLIVAARMGEQALVERLLQRGADPDSRDHRQMTSLMFCVMYGMKTMTALFLAHGASLTVRNAMGETPFLMAVSTDNVEVVKLLLEAGADVNDVANDGYPALMVATYSDFSNVVRLLLTWGVDVHRANPLGYQALHIAAWNGFATIVSLLLSAGAQPDTRTNDQNTPLSLAAHGNYDRVVDMLVERGCNVNNADKDLDTPLHYATFNANMNCINSLLQHGADPHAVNRVGVTPLWNSAYRGHLQAVKKLVKRNVALSVPTQGIDQHAQSEEAQMVLESPCTPLWVACDNGHTDIAMLLIAAGCDLNVEKWIEHDEFPGSSLGDESLKEVLKFYYGVPRPLLSQCRIALRRMAGSDVRHFVRHLPVPLKIRHFILMNEVTE